MIENRLFDDIARTLASPISRRQASARILRGLAGAALASVFTLRPARAGSCPPGQPPCVRELRAACRGGSHAVRIGASRPNRITISGLRVASQSRLGTAPALEFAAVTPPA